jgi:toxin ParE1/3/4
MGPIAKIASSYPFRLGRRLVDPEQRVGQPRHIVVYRVAADGVVEIIGIAHDRMLLASGAENAAESHRLS